MTDAPGAARFSGLTCRGVVGHARLDAGAELRSGVWAVVGDFEGRVDAWRFAEVERSPVLRTHPGRQWHGPERSAWRSSLGRDAYVAGVAAVRSAIREGDVYQVNLCRVMSAPLPAPPGREPDPWALAAVLAAGNPAPFAGVVHVPTGSGEPPVWLVTASPELYLRLGDGLVTSCPIKGTAAAPDGLSAKDEAENVMITDLVRNDLQRLCTPGTVEVVELLAVQQHPGLVHLVSTVQGALLDARPAWGDVLGATYPPASVSGAPKAAALDVIRRLEPVPRGPYCGAVGWVDADAGTAELAVGIRTFWWTPDAGGELHFGTGAGITWGSDPDAEWRETELKAARLVALASGPAEDAPGQRTREGTR